MRRPSPLRTWILIAALVLAGVGLLLVPGLPHQRPIALMPFAAAGWLGGVFTLRRAPRLAAGIAVVAVLLLIDMFAIEPDWIEVRRWRVPAPVTRELTIAHLSDLHTRGLGSRERKMLAILAAGHPDVIVISGDVAIGGGTVAGYRRVLGALHAPLGVWLTRGNWEHWLPRPDVGAELDSVGGRLLDNAAVPLAGRVWIVGLDDPRSGTPDPDRALRSVPHDAWPIAVFHSPGYFDRVADRFPLVLAGHTHGGQIRLPFWTPYVPVGSGRYVAGWYERAGSRLYVNRGVGMSYVPARLFCRPEIAFITLVPDGSAAARGAGPDGATTRPSP